VTNNASQASPEQAKVELAARALSLCICNRARKALGHEPVTDTGNAWKSHVDDARAVIAALSTDDERLREALKATTARCAQYADFIRDEVKADDLERHPYLPQLDDEVAEALAALAPKEGDGNV
jgi:hypothetical protein